MKILFLHLSDAHLKQDTNLNEINTNALVNSLSQMGEFDECVLVFSGDIVNSGNENEYKVAGGMFGKILKGINDKYFDGKKHIQTLIVPGNHDNIALEYKNKDYVLYIVGGDGTLAITLPAIVGTKNKLGIIPAGSGNDTYRSVKNLPNGEHKIDIGKINDVYFINVACIGIDAEVANNKDKFKKKFIPKNQIYNVSLIYTFFKYKFRKIKFNRR